MVASFPALKKKIEYLCRLGHLRRSPLLSGTMVDYRVGRADERLQGKADWASTDRNRRAAAVAAFDP